MNKNKTKNIQVVSSGKLEYTEEQERFQKNASAVQQAIEDAIKNKGRPQAIEGIDGVYICHFGQKNFSVFHGKEAKVLKNKSLILRYIFEDVLGIKEDPRSTFTISVVVVEAVPEPMILFFESGHQRWLPYNCIESSHANPKVTSVAGIQETSGMVFQYAEHRFQFKKTITANNGVKDHFVVNFFFIPHKVLLGRSVTPMSSAFDTYGFCRMSKMDQKGIRYWQPKFKEVIQKFCELDNKNQAVTSSDDDGLEEMSE